MNRCLIASLILFVCDSAFGGVMVSVSGTANPYRADPNVPAGLNGSATDGTVPPFLSVVGVSSITFNNTGFFAHGPGLAATSPDGGSPVGPITMGSVGRISGWNYRLNSLVGVFDPTNVGPAPAAISPAVMNFTSISPLRGQVFFIGDGLTGTGSGTRQQFIVPVGATRLYFAAVDANGWFNNTGTVTVDATMVTIATVPEPSSFAIMLGLIGMAGYGRRRRRKVA
jgi:PEP-CTERM motif